MIFQITKTAFFRCIQLFWHLEYFLNIFSLHQFYKKTWPISTSWLQKVVELTAILLLLLSEVTTIKKCSCVFNSIWDIYIRSFFKISKKISQKFIKSWSFFSYLTTFNISTSLYKHFIVLNFSIGIVLTIVDINYFLYVRYIEMNLLQ